MRFGRIAFIVVAFLSIAFIPTSSFAQSTKKNVVVFMPDDLDEASFNQLLSANLLPNIKQYILDRGVRFTNSFVTESICCPSRVSFYTGKYSHNTGTYHVEGLESGLQGLVDKGIATVNGNTITNIDWLPTWLKTNGYYVGQVGKTMNTNQYGSTIKPGFDYWRVVRDYDARPGMYRVYKDADFTPIYPDVFMTKYLGDQGIEFINNFQGQTANTNFFLQLTPTAPHISNPYWKAIPSGDLSSAFNNLPVVAYNVFDHPDSVILERRSTIVRNTNGQYESWHADLTSAGWGNWISDGLDSVIFPNTGSDPIVAFNSFVHPDTDGIRQHLIRGENVYKREVTPTLTPWVIDTTTAIAFSSTGNLPIKGFSVTNLVGEDFVQYLLRGDTTSGYELYSRARINNSLTSWQKEPEMWELGSGESPIESMGAIYRGNGRLDMHLVTQGPTGSRIYFQNVRSFYAQFPNVLGVSSGQVLADIDVVEPDLYSLAAQSAGSQISYPNLLAGSRIWADGNWRNPTQGYAPADYPNGLLPAGTLRTDGPNGFTARTGFDLPGLSKANFNNCALNFSWICTNLPDVNANVIGDKQHVDYMRRAHLDRLESMLSVDVMVGKVMTHLQQLNLLGNTLVIFTSDNGYFQGEHRLVNKQMPYEESIRVPLIIRPPNTNISTNIAVPHTVINTDHSASILEYANLWNPTYQAKVDGRSYKAILDQPTVTPSAWRTKFLVEYHFARGLNYIQNQSCWWCVPDVLAIRTGIEAPTNEGQNHLYAQYLDDPTRVGENVEYELFDINQDPNQINNLVQNPSTFVKRTFLASRIEKLKTCYAESCRRLENSVLGDIDENATVDGQDIKAMLVNFSSQISPTNLLPDGKNNMMDVGLTLENILY